MKTFLNQLTKSQVPNYTVNGGFMNKLLCAVSLVFAMVPALFAGKPEQKRVQFAEKLETFQRIKPRTHVSLWERIERVRPWKTFVCDGTGFRNCTDGSAISLTYNEWDEKPRSVMQSESEMMTDQKDWERECAIKEKVSKALMQPQMVALLDNKLRASKASISVLEYIRLAAEEKVDQERKGEA
jgi:hypothetical protein